MECPHGICPWNMLVECIICMQNIGIKLKGLSYMTINDYFNTYQSNFDSFLLQLNQEIANLCRINSGDSDLRENVEHYIYELNSFYYRSFIEKFCPDFKNAVRADISDLLQLSRQEDMIKHDIMANLKRYTKLYNQCKKIISLLADWQIENKEQQFSLAGDLEQYKLELYYALKSIQSDLLALHELIQGLKLLAEDMELMNIIKKALIPLDLLNVFSYLDENQPLLMDAHNYLLIELRKLRNSLVKLALDKESHRKLAEKARAESLLALAALIDKTDKSIQAFYQRNILEPLLVKDSLLTQYRQSGKQNQFERSAQDFLLYINGLLYILEKAVDLGPNRYKQLLQPVSWVSRIKSGYPGQLLASLDTIIKEVSELANNFPLTGEADFLYFLGKSRDILAKARSWFDTLTGNNEISDFFPSNELLGKLKLEMSYFQLRLQMLSEKQIHSAKVHSQLVNFSKMTGSYLNMITDIKTDLDRLLAPRNLSRAWKDMQIRVEHITLEKGHLFPYDYLELLDKHHVETRISEYASNTILHEEGDIFIIRVEELREEEMPYLVVSHELVSSAND